MNNIPKKIFIIPYRDRAQHKSVFINQYKHILINQSYEMFFVHQIDSRPFNRGATKNIGFLHAKEKYPNDYKHITFIFNDIDTLPYNNKTCDFHTKNGTVKHFFGFKQTLGGIIAIKGSDFEKINGFPNIWGWGYEDNALKQRWVKINGIIDYSQFYPYKDRSIVLLYHGEKKLYAKQETWNAFWNDTGLDGLKTLSKLKYNIKNENENIYMINVDTFEGMHGPPKKMTNGVPPVNFGKQSRVYSKAKQHFRSMGGLFRKKK
jgi:hypothetical protein|tara:strand:- start:616 stop:1401 length:786 start_codon:yes stop_codon:yes gene_type:complete